jgi:hypothetical protein
VYYAAPPIGRRMAPVPSKMHGRLLALALVSIAAGAAMRLSWPADMEFKGDERYGFAQAARPGVPWPSLGMPSSIGVRNPGMSVWVFQLLARASGATSPTGLCLCVMGLNVAGLALLFAFAVTLVDEAERERWLWALALVAVSPLAVLSERKIWPPSVFPVLAVIFWASFWRRDRRVGAFGWGLVGALLGQIHMSGFFFAAGVVAWEAVRGRACRDAAGAQARRPRWGAWLAGALVGALPMEPWLRYLLGQPASSNAWDWREIVTPRLWLYGAEDALGLGLQFNLGVASFLDFLGAPHIAGRPTYLVACAHVLIALVAAACAARALRGGLATLRGALGTGGATDSTSNALRAAFLGYGGLVALSGLVVQRHYLIVTYPLPWVFAAGLGLSIERHGRRVLAALWAAELIVTTSLLLHVHAHGGAPGDYGVAYRLQPASASDPAANSQVAPSR